MFVGLYGATYAAKPLDNCVPFWISFIAVQWLDLI